MVDGDVKAAHQASASAVPAAAAEDHLVQASSEAAQAPAQAGVGLALGMATSPPPMRFGEDADTEPEADSEVDAAEPIAAVGTEVALEPGGDDPGGPLHGPAGAPVSLGGPHSFLATVGGGLTLHVTLADMVGTPSSQASVLDRWESVAFRMKATNQDDWKGWTLLVGECTFEDVSAIQEGRPLSQEDWPAALEGVVRGVLDKGEAIYAELVPLHERHAELQARVEEERGAMSDARKVATKGKKKALAKTLMAGARGGTDGASEALVGMAQERAEELRALHPRGEQFAAAASAARAAIDTGAQSGVDAGLEMARGSLMELGGDQTVKLAMDHARVLQQSHADLATIAEGLSGRWLQDMAESALNGRVSIESAYHDITVRKPHFIGASTLNLTRAKGEEGADTMSLGASGSETVGKAKNTLELQADWAADTPERLSLEVDRTEKEGPEITRQRGHYRPGDEGGGDGAFSQEYTRKGKFNRLSTKEHTKASGAFQLGHDAEGGTTFGFQGAHEDAKGRTRGVTVSPERVSYDGLDAKDAALTVNQGVATEEALHVEATFNRKKLGFLKRQLVKRLMASKGVDFDALKPQTSIAVDATVDGAVEGGPWVNLTDLHATIDVPSLQTLVDGELAKLEVRGADGDVTLNYGSHKLSVPASALKAPAERAPRGWVSLNIMVSSVVNEVMDAMIADA